MRNVWYLSIGAASGLMVAIFAIAISYLFSEATRQVWGEILSWITHPIAILLSVITRQPLQAELSILIYLIAIILTFTLIGIFVGWLFYILKKQKKSVRLMQTALF